MKSAQREWSHSVSEKVFQNQVIQLARHCGWRIAHFRPAMTQRGRWVTPVQGDGTGFPDLVLARPPRLIFAELKSAKGNLSVEQAKWCGILSECTFEYDNLWVYVWRPSDFDEIVRILR